MCYKHKTRAIRWQSGALISGAPGYSGDLNFSVTNNLLHVSVSKTPRRYADFFINQINGFVEVLTTLSLLPPPPPPAPVAPPAAAQPPAAAATGAAQRTPSAR